MTANELARATLESAFKIHTDLGPGLLESVYEAVLAHQLVERGIPVTRQRAIPLTYANQTYETAFRADLIVDDQLIVEVKSTESIAEVHKKQLLTYLRLADKPLGLLLNFNETHLKNGIRRIVNNLKEQPLAPIANP